MSNLIVPDVAKVQHAKNVLNIASTHYPNKVHLFKNSVTPSHATVLSDLTECDFSGYGNWTMTGGAVSGSLDGSGRGVATWDSHTWTKSGATGNTVYGYYVTFDDNSLAWVEAFDAGIPLTVDGAFIQLTAKFTDMSQYSNT